MGFRSTEFPQFEEIEIKSSSFMNFAHDLHHVYHSEGKLELNIIFIVD